jgi:SAM-dependent methyltransferase
VITPESLIYLQTYLKLGPGVKMCELGDQQMHNFIYYPHGTYSRGLFEAWGVNYTSIDLNGLNQSLALDLTEEIKDPKLIGQFDVVTNFGCSEHVSDLYMCMKNVHLLCKENGVMIHVVPFRHNWPKHGYHYITPDFFKELSKITDYAVYDISVRGCCFNNEKSDLVHAALVKVYNNEFPDRSTFDLSAGKFIFRDSE